MPTSYPKDFAISQLRIVHVYFFHVDLQGNNIPDKVPHVHYMHESQVQVFIEATLALHFEPGINPHCNRQTSKVWEIRVSPLEVETKSYWWCCPDLKSNGSLHGAQLNRDQFFYGSSAKWSHPALLAEEKKAAEENAKAEYEYTLAEIRSRYGDK